MKKYDINKVTNGMSTKAIRVKLQIDEYVGYLKVKMGGNTSPLEVMNRILEEIVDDDIEIDEKLNPGFDFRTDAAGDHVWFYMVLNRPDGESCRVEDELEMLEYYVTGIELVGLEVDE
jgi:hypothetical protein